MMKKLTIEEITQQRLSPEELADAERFPIYVLLDDIRSLHNVGAIFRTADAARIQELLICGITGHPPRREIDKTALGAVDSVPWSYHQSAEEAVESLKARGVKIYALEHTDDCTQHWDTAYEYPCCLMIGNEVWGLRQELLQLADAAIEIPMFGSKHSLNAAVAFGVSIYSMVQRLKR